MNSERAAELVRQASQAAQDESFEVAAELAQQALQLEPEMPDALSILGIALSRLGKLEEAEGALKKVAEIRPDAAAHYNLAAHFYAVGNHEFAADHCRAALNFDPGHEAAAALLRSIEWESQSAPYTFAAPTPIETPRPFQFIADLGWSWTLLGCFLVGAYVVSRAILSFRFYEAMQGSSQSMSESERAAMVFEIFTASSSLIIGGVVWLALLSAWWLIDNAHWRKSNTLAIMLIGLVDAVFLMCCTYGVGVVVCFTLYLVLTRRATPVA
jgi:tetratricopeptide (TPR) repeat protein